MLNSIVWVTATDSDSNRLKRLEVYHSVPCLAKYNLDLGWPVKARWTCVLKNIPSLNHLYYSTISLARLQ